MRNSDLQLLHCVRACTEGLFCSVWPIKGRGGERGLCSQGVKHCRDAYSLRWRIVYQYYLTRFCPGLLTGADRPVGGWLGGQGASSSVCYGKISHWGDAVALETVQGSHPALVSIVAFVFTSMKLSPIWSCCLPCLPLWVLLKIAREGFPEYFSHYCSAEQEVRLGSVFWVLVIHFQTSMHSKG